MRYIPLPDSALSRYSASPERDEAGGFTVNPRRAHIPVAVFLGMLPFPPGEPPDAEECGTSHEIMKFDGSWRIEIELLPAWYGRLA